MYSRYLFVASFIGVLLGPVHGKGSIWKEESRLLRDRHHGFGSAFRTCFDNGPRNRGRFICHQRCVDTLRGPICTCWPGYHLASDGITCLDIDECSSGMVRCHQICRNTLGSYKCLCRPGYIMQGNGRTCTVANSKRKISASPRPGRHAHSHQSGNLYWDQRKSVLDQEYDEIYEGREDDSDVGLEETFTGGYNPSSDFLGGEKNPYLWRDEGNLPQIGVRPNEELAYSASPCRLCHQMCYWSSSGGGGVKCGCWHGYAIADGSDVGCTDIDECSVHQYLCFNGACINTIGSFICRCRPGFLLVRNTCVDINECAGVTGSQLCDQVCINTPGSYQCACHRGYSIADSGNEKRTASECVDIDECSLGSCSHLCTNYPGGFLCSCPQGMELHHDGRTCFPAIGQNVGSDFDMSKLNTGYGNNRYPVTLFTENEQIPRSHLLKEVISNPLDHGLRSVLETTDKVGGNCSAVCLNGGICSNGTCHCPNGISGDTCQYDINECLILPPDIKCTHNCTNTFGSYLCTCPLGFMLNADHRSCKSTGCMPSCLNGGTCNDSLGKCICPPGYTGAVCDIDVNECEQDNARELCQHECRNTLGSFSCLCLGRGNTLGHDKRSCITAPEFSSCVPACHNGGTCQWIPGSRNRCLCPSEFQGRYCQIDVNECTRNSSLCSYICINLHGGYRCICPPGYESSLDKNGQMIQCSPVSDVANTNISSEYNKSEIQQTYQFSVQEETLIKDNIFSVDKQFTENHMLFSSDRQDPNNGDKLKVLIEIIVSTASNSICNTSHSVYAPIYITLPSKLDSEESVDITSITVAEESSSFVFTIPVISSSSYSNDFKVNESRNESHDEMTTDSFVVFVSPSFSFSEEMASSLPNVSVEYNLATDSINHTKDIFNESNLIDLRVEKNDILSSSVFSMQSIFQHSVSYDKDVWISSTPKLELGLTNENDSSTVINVDPLDKLENISANDLIFPSSVKNINGSSLNDSSKLQTIIPDESQTVFIGSQYILPIASILPSNVFITDINLSSELFQTDVPSNLSVDTLGLTEISKVDKNETEIEESDENDLQSNFTEIPDMKQLITTEEVLLAVNVKENPSLIDIGEPVDETTVFNSLIVTEDPFDQTTAYVENQNVTNNNLSIKIEEMNNITSITIQEDIKQTKLFKENPETGIKQEKPFGKRQKSKKGKKNRRKGRKVVRLNQDFEVLNQVIHLPEDKEGNLAGSEGQLIGMKESGDNSSSGGRYFEILDYGDDEEEWYAKKNEDGSIQPKASSDFMLPSTSTALPKTPSLGIIWKERPGASELECHYSGRKFPSRSTFFRDERNCTQCFCKDGEIRCAPRHCPPPHCESPVEGDCCSYCPGDCVIGQQVFLPGERFSPHLDPCRECRCDKGGRALCQDIICPPLNCDPEFRAIMPGECCPACLPPEPGCFHRGRFFYQGQLWVRQEGGCHACLCKKDGEVQCNPVVCVVNCQHPQFVTGECCPICDGCQYNNQKYNDQQIFPHPTEKCSLCQCQQGNITCFPKPCAVNCSHPYKLSHDQCCPECKDCLFNGYRISDGKSLMISEGTCEECTCLSGEVTCKENTCVSGCVLDNKTWPSGAEFSPGNDPCTVCRCWDGAVMCQAISCPESCSHGILLPGSCCLHCEQCDYQGKLYNDLDVFQPNEDKCSSCLCKKGNIICKDICTSDQLSQN